MLQRLALILSLGAALSAPNLTPALAAESVRPEFDPAVIQQLINDYRRSHGLTPVEINPKLTAAAREHSEDLARHDTISHQGSDGSQPWTRVERTGYPARFTAENVGCGQKSMDQLIMGWRKSPPHNANLLAAHARQMGIAMAYRPGTRFKTYWTLVLGAQRDADKQYKPRKKPAPGKAVVATRAKPPAKAGAAPVATGAAPAAPATITAAPAKPPAMRPPVMTSAVPAAASAPAAPQAPATAPVLAPSVVQEDPAASVTIVSKQQDLTKKAP